MKKISDHAHNTGCWYLLGVLSKFPTSTPLSFFNGSPQSFYLKFREVCFPKTASYIKHFSSKATWSTLFLCIAIARNASKKWQHFIFVLCSQQYFKSNVLFAGFEKSKFAVLFMLSSLWQEDRGQQDKRWWKPSAVIPFEENCSPDRPSVKNIVSSCFLSLCHDLLLYICNSVN